MLGSHLCNEDPNDNSQLMQSSQRPTDGCGGYFLHVNGHKAGGEARVKTHDETADDEHLKRCGQLGERHECNGKEGDGVGHEHGVLPSKTHIASSVFESFLELRAKKPLPIVPAKAVDKEPDGEGAQHSSHRENGHRERPQRCESGLRDGLGIPVGPRLIVEALNNLKHKTIYCTIGIQHDLTWSGCSILNSLEAMKLFLMIRLKKRLPTATHTLPFTI